MKIPTLIRWTMLFFPFLALSQNSLRIDSLLQQLSAAEDLAAEAHVSGELWSEYINYDIQAAAGRAERIIRIGTTLHRDDIMGFGYEKKGITHAYQGQFDSSGVYFRAALRLHVKAEDYERVASVQRNLGQDHAMAGELDSAFHYYRAAGENFARIGDSVGMADIYNSEAITYYAKGFHNLAFDQAVAAEKIFRRRAGQALDLNQNRLVIASIYAAMKDTVNAIDYFQKTIDYFAENDLPRQFTSTAVLLIELQLPNYQNYPALDTLIGKMHVYADALNDPTLRQQARLAKAGLAYQRGNYPEALTIQKAVVAQDRAAGQELMLAQSSLELGKTLLATREYSAAIRALQTTNRFAEQVGITALERDAKQLIARAYELSGDYRNGLSYFKDYKMLDEKIYTEERVNRFNELQTIYEIEKKESTLALQAEEIKTLNAEARNNRLTRTLYAIGMVSFILISGLLYFGFRQRMKRNRIEREKQEATFRQEIAFKKKELTSQTLHLVQKNTFLQELGTKLAAIKQSPELFKTEFRQLTSLLERQTDEDTTWEVFKSYFAQVHNDFDHQLKAIAGELTENDIRLASFLRMNLTTKEIASLLHVLPDSVLKSKYRLKKKMGLSKEQDLVAYLNTL